MKGKRILGGLLSAVMLFSTACGTAVNAQTKEHKDLNEDYTIEWYIPDTYKVGDWIRDVTTSQKGEEVLGIVTGLPEDSVLSCRPTENHTYFPPHKGDSSTVINGVADIYYDLDSFYAPGTETIQLWSWTQGGKDELLKAPLEITVEEPVIKTNAPKSIQVGQTLDFTTELTNTSLKNEEVSPYLNPDNYDWFYEDILAGDSFNPNENWWNSDCHNIAYLPKVEVIEGQNLVTQSKQNYNNILNSSETLSFTGAGTVKLKVTYQQIMTCKDLGKWELDENGTPVKLLEDYRYNPTDIITIQVKEPPVSITDQETGIQLDAEGGVVPADTALKVEKLTDGEKYAMVSNALKEKAEQFEAFDFSLLLNGKEVQPNGTTKVTMPIPSGYDTERLAVFYISDQGTLTQMAFTLSENKEYLSFETDHFNIYALAQLKQQSTPGDEDTDQDTSSDSNQNINGGNQTNVPQTGDTTAVFPAFIVLAIAGSSLCILTFLRKRKAN